MNAGSDGNADLEDLLEHELRRRVGSLRAPSPWAAQAAYRAVAPRGGKRMPLLSSLTAAASSKAAVGLATAALVMGGGSAAAAAAVTGSTDPGAWGRTVTAAVASCKSHLAAGDHGIGHCVSDVASRKGQAERSEHTAGSAPTAEPSGHPTGRPSTVPAAHPTGPPASHPTPHSTGKPGEASGSGHPTTPAATPTPR